MFAFKKRRRLVLLGVGGTLFLALFTLWQSTIKKNRQIPVGPFHIVGNLYYVGTTNVTSFLLTGPDGHAIITCNNSQITLGLLAHLQSDGIPTYIIQPDKEEAARQYVDGLPVIVGEADTLETFKALKIHGAPPPI